MCVMDYSCRVVRTLLGLDLFLTTYMLLSSTVRIAMYSALDRVLSTEYVLLVVSIHTDHLQGRDHEKHRACNVPR